ncbi:MAG: hypothetical protein V9G24_16335 [Rhodoblastus sp.]
MILDPIGTLISLLTSFGVAAMIALSLNLEYGLGGIPNFGKALFVSIGACTGRHYLHAGCCRCWRGRPRPIHAARA